MTNELESIESGELTWEHMTPERVMTAKGKGRLMSTTNYGDRTPGTIVHDFVKFNVTLDNGEKCSFNPQDVKRIKEE